MGQGTFREIGTLSTEQFQHGWSLSYQAAEILEVLNSYVNSIGLHSKGESTLDLCDNFATCFIDKIALLHLT